MMTDINIEQVIGQSLAWFQQHIWNMDSLIQIMIVAAALIIGYALNRLSRNTIVNAINKIETSPRFKKVLHNLRQLVFPLTAVFLLFLVEIPVTSGLIPIEFAIAHAAMSLLVAWILIRLFVQFIDNSALRNLVAVSVWVFAALSILGILDETATTLDKLGMDLGEFRLSALTLVKGMIALFILLYITSLISTVIERKIQQVSGLTMTSKVLISKIIRIILVTFAILAGVTSAGIDLSLLAVFSGALGLGIGFGLQKGISNLFSGLLLLMDKSITPGDILELQDGTFGWVAKMGGRYTEIVSRDNKSFLIPNENFITQQVVNWSHGDTLVRLETTFGVHYKSDPHIVKELAEEAARLPDRVVDDPPPMCHLIEFGDSSLNFVLRYWIKDAQEGVTNTRGTVMLALWDSFKEHGIQIPYPHREVYLHESKEA